jgi:uncharacterized protein
MLKAALGDVVDQSAEGLTELVSEDAIMEFPYAPPGRPKRVIGRAALDQYLRRIEGLFAIESHTDPVVHRTTDPNVVILEYSIHARVNGNGQPYDQTYISVITLKDKKIVHFKDYWNPMAIQSLAV